MIFLLILKDLSLKTFISIGRNEMLNHSFLLEILIHCFIFYEILLVLKKNSPIFFQLFLQKENFFHNFERKNNMKRQGDIEGLFNEIL